MNNSRFSLSGIAVILILCSLSVASAQMSFRSDEKWNEGACWDMVEFLASYIGMDTLHYPNLTPKTLFLTLKSMSDADFQKEIDRYTNMKEAGLMSEKSAKVFEKLVKMAKDVRDHCFAPNERISDRAGKKTSRNMGFGW